MFKPCPFCGSIELATYRNSAIAKAGLPAHAMYCMICKAEGPGAESGEEAINKWQERWKKEEA